jgi:hypothetical protein
MILLDRFHQLRLAVTVVTGVTLGFSNAHGQGTGPGNPPGGFGVYAGGIFSAEPSSTEGALTLLLPMGARAVAMGRAVTASQGNESAFWNPAGLARIEHGRFVVLRGNSLAGEATAFSLILARQPLGTLTISYQLLDLGDQDYLDKDGNVLGTVSFRDHLGIVSFASQILPWLDTGLNFKVFQTRASCQGQCTTSGPTGTTYLLDAGLLAFPLPSQTLRLGLMVAHAGPDLQLINVEQADPPPTRLRVAAAYEFLNHFLEREALQLWATMEIEDRVRELGSPVLYLGAEFVAGEADQIFVRAGYGQGQTGQPAGIAVGLGIKYQQFEIGIGKALSATSLVDDSEPVHVTFGVIF